MTIRKTALTIALAAMFTAGGTAMAQSYDALDQPGFGASTPTAALTDQTLDTFVHAFVAVQDVLEDYTERLHSASEEREAQELQLEAQERMVRAVEAAGMSVQEYNEVVVALQNDPELMQRVQQKAMERM
jgi:hypothetical protein